MDSRKETNYQPTLFNKAHTVQHAFIVCRSWEQQNYDPLAFFNEDPVSQLASTRSHALSFDSLTSANNHFKYATQIRKMGERYILEIDLPKKQIDALLAEKKFEDILSHVINIHPDKHAREIHVDEDISTVRVKYEAGRLVKKDKAEIEPISDAALRCG